MTSYSNYHQTIFRSSCPEVFCKKGVLKNFVKLTAKHMRRSLFFKRLKIKFKKKTLAKAFSFEFCETFKNTFFTEHLWTTASEICQIKHCIYMYMIHMCLPIFPVFAHYWKKLFAHHCIICSKSCFNKLVFSHVASETFSCM